MVLIEIRQLGGIAEGPSCGGVGIALRLGPGCGGVGIALRVGPGYRGVGIALRSGPGCGGVGIALSLVSGCGGVDGKKGRRERGILYSSHELISSFPLPLPGCHAPDLWPKARNNLPRRWGKRATDRIAIYAYITYITYQFIMNRSTRQCHRLRPVFTGRHHKSNGSS